MEEKPENACFTRPITDKLHFEKPAPRLIAHSSWWSDFVQRKSILHDSPPKDSGVGQVVGGGSCRIDFSTFGYRRAQPVAKEAVSYGTTSQPDMGWRSVALHGKRIGTWACPICLLSYLLCVRVYEWLANYTRQDHSDWWWLVAWALLLGAALGQATGYLFGMVVGRLATQQIARAVTATVTIAFWLAFVGMVAAFAVGQRHPVL